MSGGACPSGTGLSPTVEPASSLDGFATSIPSAWVVMRSIGEYSDRYETPAAIFSSEAEAETYILAADEQWRVASARLPRAGWEVDDRDALASEWAAALTVDPGACPSVYGVAEQPYYSAHETPFLDAQAIEARRAATGTGAVHESAVPQGMRPENSQ